MVRDVRRAESVARDWQPEAAALAPNLQTDLNTYFAVSSLGIAVLLMHRQKDVLPVLPVRLHAPPPFWTSGPGHPRLVHRRCADTYLAAERHEARPATRHPSPPSYTIEADGSHVEPYAFR